MDLKVKTLLNEIIIIEVQYDSEYDYLHRLAYGSSKVISEDINLGEAYSKIAKVISVNIVYFNLGIGDNYIYYGKTEFTGIHTHSILDLSETQKTLYKKENIHEIYPE